MNNSFNIVMDQEIIWNKIDVINNLCVDCFWIPKWGYYLAILDYLALIVYGSMSISMALIQLENNSNNKKQH